MTASAVKSGRSNSAPAAASADNLSHLPPDLAALVDGADAAYLGSMIAQLKLDLARREAEVEKLQGALAEAMAGVAPGRQEALAAALAAPGATTLDRLRDQLASTKSEMAAALATANSLVRRLADVGDMSGAAGGPGSPGRLAPSRSVGFGALGLDARDGELMPGALTRAMAALSEQVQERVVEERVALRQAQGMASKPGTCAASTMRCSQCTVFAHRTH